MYVPKHFEETRLEVLHAVINEHPFGMLVTLGAAGLDVNHIPFVLDADTGPLGTLRAHVARANPVWKNLTASVEPVAVFQGPHTYITPSWYPGKLEHGKVVPTWNYVAVHAHGPVRVIEDRAALREHVTKLTTAQESKETSPWQVSDAPADFIDQMVGAIVGIEIAIAKLNGKWKVSQNRQASDRRGVMDGLESRRDSGSAAMARLIGETL